MYLCTRVVDVGAYDGRQHFNTERKSYIIMYIISYDLCKGYTMLSRITFMFIY